MIKAKVKKKYVDIPSDYRRKLTKAFMCGVLPSRTVDSIQLFEAEATDPTVVTIGPWYESC